MSSLKTIFTVVSFGLYLVYAQALFAREFSADTPAQLIGAIESANKLAGPDLIRLQADKVYSFSKIYAGDRALPPITGMLSIEGNDATLTWTGSRRGDASGGFFKVTDAGKLELSKLSFTRSGETAIIVEGTLDARDCRFEFNDGPNGTALRIGQGGRALLTQCVFLEIGEHILVGFEIEVTAKFKIYNAGDLTLKLSTLYTNDTSTTDETSKSRGTNKGRTKFLPAVYVFPTLYNEGTAHFTNVTVDGYSFVNQGRLTLTNATLNEVILGRARIGNSLLVNTVCSPTAVSLGHNITTVGDCLQGQQGVSVVSPLNLALGPLQTAQAIPTYNPAPGSAPVDAMSGAQCPAKDALGRPRPLDGDHDGVARCDIGAVELQPGVYPVDARVAGLWYEPDRDGHYFVIERPTAERVVVFWATYNDAGEPLWLYGSGPVAGNQTAELTLYRQTGMQFGSFDRADLSFDVWGTMQITFQNCQSATAVWQVRAKPALSGSASISKLANVRGQTCRP